ncbi:hypothetical protein HanRHA438_Chr01g0028571 [Helianthus annuus]|nr:hypothetical protein HanRHA438_Chr01g0028571 [Helianthus annuus]
MLGKKIKKVGQSLIVRTSDLPTVVKLDKLLAKCEGIKVGLKYVGGLYMLLCFESLEELFSFKDSNPYVNDWFSWMEIWNGQALPFERIAWLKITGVPLHLLDNEVFDSVGRLFGKVVHTSSLSMDSNDLTYDLVGVLVGDGCRISDSVMLKWKDRKFMVWVNEETGDWVPDCLMADEGWEERSEPEVDLDRGDGVNVGQKDTAEKQVASRLNAAEVGMGAISLTRRNRISRKSKGLVMMVVCRFRIQELRGLVPRFGKREKSQLTSGRVGLVVSSGMDLGLTGRFGPKEGKV